MTSGGVDHEPDCLIGRLYEEVDPSEYSRDESERDWAERWTTAWDRLERHGVVSNPEDSGMTLSELERLTALLGPDKQS